MKNPIENQYLILNYQDQHPQLRDKFQRFDLFAPTFKLSCLNRLQLNNGKQMIDLDDPVALLQFVGSLDNPIASYSSAQLFNSFGGRFSKRLIVIIKKSPS